ncbi:hypothetical protein U9M48_035459 [Paspalum notatum var. saurae]|uniref:Reverse transcriptase domain-containing protein n=1 Tax=Paspalum notatum var. saurae TaxID=547442 RepID=A0AAQ3UB44_PASNO
MIHSFGKLVSKVLASRLAPFMKMLVAPNQTAFIRGRSILDSFKFVQSAAALFRKKQIPKMLLKLDISKAFDTLSSAFLLEVLSALGFSARWRDWIAILLGSASSRILVNGVPGDTISHRRGVRQGDSLSPLIFVLAMDSLNRLVDKAVEAGILHNLEIPQVKYHCRLYADDAILFASPSVQEASALKHLLHTFGTASRLTTNLGKCSISPIACPLEQLTLVAGTLGCAVVVLPITYLGLPLSSKALSRPKIHGLIDSVANRLPSALGPMLTRSGRLIWIKSVLTAVPLYAMMADHLPAWARRDIERICRRFFWAGSDASTCGKCAVAWPIVTRPTSLGGLGVADLKLTSMALQVRWLWLQKQEDDRVWSGLQITVRKEV